MLSALMLLSILIVPIVSAQQDTSQPVHVVRYGETLFSIAVRYNTTVAALAALNDIRNPNLIFVGQVIRIGGPGVVPPPTSVPPTPPPTGETTYTVVRGDTLNRIAQRFGVTVSAIVTRNGLANPNLIYPGQRLIIPAPGTTPVPPTAVPPTGVPPTQAPPPTQQPGGTIHIVQRGESLNTIARRYGVTVSAIVAANNIVNPNLIYPGQRLIIPTGGVVPTPPPGTGVPPTLPPSTINPGPGPIGGFQLGGHIFSYNYVAQMRRAGMTWAKTQIRWNGSDGPDIARGAIEAARAQGFRILLSIVGEPAQLAANPTAYYQSFANFLSGVAALGPDAIEVWN
ncbi:MAG: LysM peptidoglycan-binding domain-containing protein, partial [Dehalococcoidia bacterium]|nr:LysM peptidoglycan-binding domain-containing protein [Dehalococcoidia bacterium]